MLLTRILDGFVLKSQVRWRREVDMFGVEEYWFVSHICILKQFSSWVSEKLLVYMRASRQQWSYITKKVAHNFAFIKNLPLLLLFFWLHFCYMLKFVFSKKTQGTIVWRILNAAMWHDKLITQETSSLRLENASIKKQLYVFSWKNVICNRVTSKFKRGGKRFSKRGKMTEKKRKKRK